MNTPAWALPILLGVTNPPRLLPLAQPRMATIFSHCWARRGATLGLQSFHSGIAGAEQCWSLTVTAIVPSRVRDRRLRLPTGQQLRPCNPTDLTRNAALRGQQCRGLPSYSAVSPMASCRVPPSGPSHLSGAAFLGISCLGVCSAGLGSDLSVLRNLESCSHHRQTVGLALLLGPTSSSWN